MILRRLTYEESGIYGILTDDNGTTIAYTLEHAFDDGDGNFIPKVNIGQHTCILGTHQLDHGDPIQTYEITGVSNHSGILFHIGNYNKDSDGCVLLGETRVGDMVTNSHTTFQNFMNSLNGINSFQLTVQ